MNVTLEQIEKMETFKPVERCDPSRAEARECRGLLKFSKVRRAKDGSHAIVIRTCDACGRTQKSNVGFFKASL